MEYFVANLDLSFLGIGLNLFFGESVKACADDVEIKTLGAPT